MVSILPKRYRCVSSSLLTFVFDNARDSVRHYAFADYQGQLSLPLDDVSGIGKSYDLLGVIRRLSVHEGRYAVT